MAEVPNQKVIERYKELLSQRTHDVIVMNLAIEILEARVTELVNEKTRLEHENQRLQNIVEEGPPDQSDVIPGEIIE